MGCFNMVGFYSNMPIKYQDDIVYFICASYGKLDDSNVLEPNNIIEPICLPIFGKYNDYGTIEDIVCDINVQTIERTFNMQINNIVQIIEDNSFITINESKNEDYKNILSKLLDSQWFRDKENISLCVTMEHKLVYDTMTTLFNDNYTTELGEKLDEMLDFIKEQKSRYFNLFNHSPHKYNVHTICYIQQKMMDSNMSSEEVIKNLSKEEMEEWQKYIKRDRINFDIWHKMNIFESYLPIRDLYFSMMMYNVVQLDFFELKDDVLNFLLFNNSLRLLCGKYIISSYGLQALTEFKKEFMTMQECYKKIINKLDKYEI